MMVVMVIEKIERRLKVAKEVEIRSKPNHPDNMLWVLHGDGLFLRTASMQGRCVSS